MKNNLKEQIVKYYGILKTLLKKYFFPLKCIFIWQIVLTIISFNITNFVTAIILGLLIYLAKYD